MSLADLLVSLDLRLVPPMVDLVVLVVDAVVGAVDAVVLEVDSEEAMVVVPALRTLMVLKLVLHIVSNPLVIWHISLLTS